MPVKFRDSYPECFPPEAKIALHLEAEANLAEDLRDGRLGWQS